MSEIQRYGAFSDYLLLRKQDDGRYVLYADFETLTDQFAEQTQQLFDTRAERASLKAQLAAMQWISVEERLPETEADVIVLREDKSRRIGWYHHTKQSWRPEYGIEVTHWMPLPEPPKGDSTNG